MVHVGGTLLIAPLHANQPSDDYLTRSQVNEIIQLAWSDNGEPSFHHRASYPIIKLRNSHSSRKWRAKLSGEYVTIYDEFSIAIWNWERNTRGFIRAVVAGGQVCNSILAV